MKIFIGGIKGVQKASFIRSHPRATLFFAGEDDRPAIWQKEAAKAEHHIVFQHRTDHRLTDTLKRIGVKPLFTDSVPVAHQIIEELLTYGKAGHRYTGSQGSQGAAAPSTEAHGNVDGSVHRSVP